MKIRILLSFFMLVTFGPAFAAQIPPKSFDLPARTTWAPQGCRIVPAVNEVQPSTIAWRNLHADEVNSDEISIALAPVFREGWTAEPDTWNPTGPVFDGAGNLYFSPLFPYEDVVLISLDPKDGSRRFSISNRTGAMVGASSPMILTEPGACPNEKPKDIIYLSLYDRAFALNADGTVVWDLPTGLSSAEPQFSFGINYAPTIDAVVGLMSDGFVYALDRRTGAPVLNAPFQLPGEKSPPGSAGGLPPAVAQCVAQDLARFLDMSKTSFAQIFETLQGNNVEVANFFSIDANTGDLWIAATAPDGEDGANDGISALGALYKLAFVPSGDNYDLVEICHASFEGGSASTPALNKDGTRAYVGDNIGKLITIDTSDCSRVWELDVGSKITGSIGVASDNKEIYVPTRPNILKVIDEGDQGVLDWISDTDAFELPPGLITMNQNLVSIGANGIGVQIGVGYPPSHPLSVGIGLLDRETGALRWFEAGGEQTVAELSTGPDGAIYVPNSGLRTAITNCLAEAGIVPFGGDPQIGGITKFSPARLDLLARDAVCAGADRARNALKSCHECRESAAADVTQILALIHQAGEAAEQAEADGDLSAREVKILKVKLDLAAKMLKIFGVHGLQPVQRFLAAGCRVLDQR